VDWERREFLVSRSISKFRVKGKLHRWSWKLGATKTRKSRRRIGLNDEVIKVLKNLRQTTHNLMDSSLLKPTAITSIQS
jgi:hypothetical protein